MKRPLLIIVLGLVCLTLAGPEAIGRILLWTGFSGPASRLAAFVDDPASRGLMLYRGGRHAEADAALRQAGRDQTFNRALTLAATGRHGLAVAYLDAVLFANPADAEAAATRDLILPFAPVVRGDSNAPGRITGYGGNMAPTPPGGQGLPSTPDPEAQKPFAARSYAASDAWLETIADDPGEFLRLRLDKEYERRAALGLVRPQEADPW
ncbi:hypothetical protein HDIA_1829 [Hartmannibacter diazotrophicus]|uniref:Ca-activated chloride channel family protein n=1 Tax=Hartmannibacter diazotrophicus TaxID=1482074 RepID=A0A2C9D5A6_9HYPH|nr:hypothetical protein [Hartmannibacter diazotrophicus]SON55370.1 hypothetical protein HDIA_1829 [Hartmannibacter diazotrophicus]